jgi:uncharacterized protein involved in cysteine biosynthesis
MLAALILSFAQLGETAILRILLRSLVLTLVLFGLAAWGIFSAIAHIDSAGWPGWAQWLWGGGGGSSAAAFLVTALLLWLSFTGIATGVIGLWLDDVIAAVEVRYYPAARATPLGLRREAGMAIAAALRVILWNALFLPAYILLAFTGIGPLLLFIAINAWLLGREYLETVAVRHLPADAAEAWPQQQRLDRWGTGIITAGLFALPIANLVAPVIGIAFATHMFHRRNP